MLKRILPLFFLLPFQSVWTQTITISEEIPLRNDYSYTILGWIDDDLLLFRDRGHEYFVQAFDEEMHLKWEREVYLGSRKADIIGVISHNDRFHLLFGMREKGDYILQHWSFDHAVSLIDTMTIDIVPNIFMTPRFLLTNSEDKSKILLFRDANNAVQLISYDLNERSVLWRNSIEFSGLRLYRDFSPMEVSNNGNAYLVMEPDRFLQKVQELEVFTATAGEVSHETLHLGDYQAYDFHVQYDNLNHFLVIAGLYSDKNSLKAQGFYFFRYKPGQTQRMHLLSFDESLLTEVHGKDVPGSRGLSDFHVKKVALRKDGGAVLIAELNKEFARRSTLPVRKENGSFARGGWVDYYYEDIILYAVNPDGSEHWKKVLHKRQYSQDDDAIYSSFFLFKTPDRLRFLFNDEIKQENTVGGYEVTGTGYVERKTVFNTDYQKLKLRFKNGLQVAYNECIIPSERNNRLNLVRIKYD